MHKVSKKVVMLLLVGICISAIGCGEKVNNKKAEKEDILTGSSIETVPESINNNDAKYTIKTKSIVTNNIHVSYPQIIGMENSEIQNKWNNIIKAKVEAGINNVGNKDTYVLSYKVKTQNEKMISILIEGETSSAATDYDKYVFMYTFNIDVETGECIRLKDRVDTEKIATNFMAGKRYSVKNADNSVFREYLNLFYKDKDSIRDDLNNYDFGENMGFVRGYSYFESGSVYLCVNVNHNLGDYIEVLIDN